MPRTRIIQASFTSGELDPRLAARADARIYYAGAERMKNVLVLPMGGFRRRPGQQYLATIADAGSGARLVPFSFNTEQDYLMVFTNGVIRIFKDDALVHTISSSVPWTGAQVEQINWVQSADTLIVFHPDVQPYKLVRGGSHTSWTLSAITFSNIPTYDFGSGAEAVISVTRGWPSCGTFHQGRLFVGGLKSRPATILGSKVGSFFDLNKGTSLADEGIDVTLDTDQVNAIYNLVSGRHLTVFTSGSEHAVMVDPPITPTNIAVSQQSARGSKPYVRPVEVDGAFLFVQRGGKAIREFLFTVTEDAYAANILSLLSPHLIKNPRDLDIRKGNSLDDADYVIAVNADDGTVTFLNTLRSQEVNAFTWAQTDGTYERVAVLGGDVYWLVERTIGGSPAYYLEKWNDDTTTDSCVLGSSFPASSLSGLSHLNGETVKVIVDGAMRADAVVSGGAVTLDPAAQTSVEVGLDYEVSVTGMPIEGRLPDGTMVGRQTRIVQITGRLYETKGLRINGNLVVFRALGPVGVGPLDEPVEAQTGDFKVHGLQGWSGRAQFEVTQDSPMPLTVLGMAMLVRVS